LRLRVGFRGTGCVAFDHGFGGQGLKAHQPPAVSEPAVREAERIV
jgi:hypothetical protein